MPSIPTSNILQPGAIALTGGVTRGLISDLQLLTPEYWTKYTEKYGRENFLTWLATFGGMEEVKNLEYFWFENRGKNMLAVSPAANVTSITAGASVTITLSAGDHFNSGTQSALREGETVRLASTNVEGKIISVDRTTPNAFTFVVRPLKSNQAFAGPSGNSILVGDVIKLAGMTDVGEASDSATTQTHLDVKYTNTVTQFHDSHEATDLGEMTDIWYNNGVSGSTMAGNQQAGTSYFTYKSLVKMTGRFENNINFKLMFGDKVTNTGLNTNSQGSQGIIPKVQVDGETVTYSGGVIDFAKMQEITRVMDVNGCPQQNIWLMDINQKQQFSNGIFNQLPAGAFVWGQGEKSQEASISYGFKEVYIGGYQFQTQKHSDFNSEVVYGKTPTVDYFRNFGLIMPLGSTTDSKTGNKMKNLSIMYQEPPKGGTIGNGIRCWTHGGASLNPTNGKMEDVAEIVTYRGTRIAAANQFLLVTGS
jgi:hypothetical protein